MSSTPYTPLRLLLLSALLLSTVPVHAQSVTQGFFELGSKNPNKCASSLTLHTDTTSTSDPTLSLSSFACAGPTLSFSDLRNDSGAFTASLDVSGIDTLQGVTLQTDLTCGNQTLPSGTLLVYVIISKNTLSTLKAPLLLFFSNDDRLKPFVDVLKVVDLSKGTLIASSTGCAWRRTGDAPKRSATPTPSLSPSPTLGTTSDTNNNTTTGQSSNSSNSSNACFPGSALVALADGSTRLMSELRIGDIVATRHGHFSPVLLWTHHDVHIHHHFVRIHMMHMSSPRKVTELVVSHGHFVYADGMPRPAATISVGMMMEGEDGKMMQVVKMDEVVAKGLYNPQTMDGDIIVQGVRCSTYTTAVKPAAAHALLAPVRAAFQVLASVRAVVVQRASL